MPVGYSASASSSARGQMDGAGNFMASGPGDWNVNMAGSGTSAQGLSAGGVPTWMLIAAGLVALYLLKK